MGTLNFGRLALPDYTQWQMQSRNGKHIDRLTLWLQGASLAATKNLRTELRGHESDYIAISYSSDSDVDGFYYVDSVRITSAARQASLQNTGLFRADISVSFVGDYASTEIQSLLTQISADEDHSVTPSYWWAPASGAKAVNAGSTTTTLVERIGDATLDVAYDISADINPTWSVAPSAYYTGAVEFYAGDVLRTGTEMPMDPADWYIGNDLMQVRPGNFQVGSNGRLQVRFNDATSWGSWVSFQINNAGSNTIDSWDFVTCLVNTPSLVVVRLIRDALEAPFATTALHQLDIALRRGGVHTDCIYSYTKVNGTHALEADETDTATRPGAAGNYVYLDTLVSGDRIIYGCHKAYALSGLEIQLSSSASHMPFFIGAGINDNSDAGNQASDIADQAVGQSPEVVRPVRR